MSVNVGLVCTSMSRKAGGVSVVLRHAVQGLVALGCDVTVYALRDEHSEADKAQWGDIRLELFDPIGPAALGFSTQLANSLGEHDLLHQHGIWQGPSVAVSNWRKQTGKPVVISPHGMLDPWALANSGWKKRIAGALYENANLRGAACVHALAEAEGEAIRGAGFTNPVAQIPNGIDLPDEPCPPKGQGERKTLLFLGRLHPKKGLSELLSAWGIIASNNPEIAARWKVVIAGWDDGGHREALMEQAASLPQAVEVEFPGALHGADKHAALCDADAFVLPSFSEGLPIAVLEAWAYGVPVFMTDECNLPEGFAADAAVRISTDPGELADILGTRLEGDDLADMAARARALVAEKFTWDSVARQYLTMYQYVLGHEERPDFVSAGP